MKRLLIYSAIFILAIAIWLGIKIQHDPGYVLIVYQHTRIEMTLIFALINLVILVFLIYWLTRLIGVGITLPSRWRHWFIRRQRQKSQRQLQIGLCAFAEGDWALAEMQLAQVADQFKDTEQLAYFYYLQAAQAAQFQNQQQRRDHYLSLALSNAPDDKARLSIQLSHVRLLLEMKNYQAASTILQRERHQHPHHPILLSLLIPVYKGLGDWDALLELIPCLRRYKVCSLDRLHSLQVIAYASQLTQLIQSKSSHESVENYWCTLPRVIQQQEKLVYLYAQYLHDRHDNTHDEEASYLLIKLLKRSWSIKCASLYGSLKLSDTKRQIAQLERWLLDHPNDALLLLGLGRLYAYQNHWQKASDYLQSSLRQKPSALVYAWLALVYEQLDKHEQARQYYSQSRSILEKSGEAVYDSCMREPDKGNQDNNK